MEFVGRFGEFLPSPEVQLGMLPTPQILLELRAQTPSGNAPFPSGGVTLENFGNFPLLAQDNSCSWAPKWLFLVIFVPGKVSALPQQPVWNSVW